MSGRGEHLTPVEQHLGDRLAAFVDGELHDDARDRVLSHLATCPGCKAAADDQRHLKNAVKAAAPPALSEGLLARLQGLPGGGLPGGDGGSGSGPFDGGGSGGARDGVLEATSLGGQRLTGDVFGRHREGFPPADDVAPPSDGFRIHEVERPGNASRGRRFAFAAAGAFSMAAIALGGALPLEGVADGGPEEPGPAVTPLSVRATEVADSRGVGGARAQGEDLVVGSPSVASASSTSATASSSAPSTAPPAAGSSPAMVGRSLVLPQTVPAPVDSPLPLLGSTSATP